jgi:hypothetical protein
MLLLAIIESQGIHSLLNEGIAIFHLREGGMSIKKYELDEFWAATERPSRAEGRHGERPYLVKNRIAGSLSNTRQEGAFGGYFFFPLTLLGGRVWWGDLKPARKIPTRISCGRGKLPFFL